MYSLETLRAMNRREVSRHYRNKPLLPVRTGDDCRRAPDYTGGDIPTIAKHFGVVVEQEFFVDSSGFGGSGEAALTFPRFCEKVNALISAKPERAYYAAVTGAGQFQVYVTIFSKEVRQHKTGRAAA